MKLAPSWTQGVPYLPSVRKLFESSGGIGINHVSLLAQFKDYAAENHLDVTEDDADTGIYRIRTLMNQLCNHKTKSRRCSDTKTPQHARCHYQTLHDKFSPTDEDNTMTDEEQIECLGTPPRLPAPLIDVDAMEISDSDDDGEAAVLSSSNPNLAALLAETHGDDDDSQRSAPTHRNLRRKSYKQPPVSTIVEAEVASRLSASAITSLAGVGGGGVDKKQWMVLNASLKEREKEKRRPKGGERQPMKAMKAMKAMKRMGKERVEFKVYIKRVHSAAYHLERAAQLSAGKSAAHAKSAACRAGCEATQKLRTDTANGVPLPAFVLLPGAVL